MKNTAFLLGFVCLLAPGFSHQARAQTYTFTTIAGSASVGSADGPAASAHFSGPSSIVVDIHGNIYVADYGNDIVREITSAGLVSTIAGQVGVAGYADGIGTNALFTTPRSLAGDAAGNLYLVDNDMIRKLTLSGTNWSVSTLAGQAGVQGYLDANGTNAIFCTPSGVAVDAAGNVYVADQCNDLIREIAPNGDVSTIAGQAHHPGSANGTNTAAQFYFPFNISLDAATNLYISDSVNDMIRMVAPVGPNWVVSTIAGQPEVAGNVDGIGTNAEFNGPGGIVVDTATNIYVADDVDNTIRKITRAGTNWQVITFAGQSSISGGHANGIGNQARFSSPNGLGADAAGDVYVADAGNNTIREITTNAMVSTFAGVSFGSADGPGTSALFWWTAGLALDAAGNVYVADYYNATIRKISTNGIVSTIAGQPGNLGSADGTNGDAQFDYPYNLVVDAQTNIYVTDVYNCTVRKVSPSGTNWVVTTIAGNIFSPGEVDGTGTNASFYVPTGIGMDHAGNLFVADDYGATIRELTPSGTNWMVGTIAGQAFSFGHQDGTNASFYFPHGLVVDAATNIYLADQENDAVRKIFRIGTNWTVTTIAGQLTVHGTTDGVGTNAQFYFPTGIGLDSTGNLYLADTYNQTIRKLTPSGTNWIVTTIAGRVGVQGSTDGPATNALFNYLQGVVPDSAGNLYVADTKNATVRLGVLASSLPPLLQITNGSSGQVVLTWPLSAAGFTLQTSGTVSAGASWASLNNGIAIVGKNFSHTENANATNVFYRLQK